MKYILVNGRSPRSESSCAMCCEAIGQSYVRELATRRMYCGAKCYAAHWRLAAPAFKERAKALLRHS